METESVTHERRQKWQRKATALITAILIWFFVSNSIDDSKTVSNVPVRVINLPKDKTVIGLQPNGLLSKRMTLKLTGTKRVIDDLETGDFEVLLDASTLTSDVSLIQISKKNLISLNPSINLADHITAPIEFNELLIKLSPVTTEKIPVTLLPPMGAAPSGYTYLDYWPQQLYQSVTGPEELVQQLKTEGLKLQFDLNQIKKGELDKLTVSRDNFHDDEIVWMIPARWKTITIPLYQETTTELNDPEAKELHIDFLREETLPLNADLPVRVFYPLNTLDRLNPLTTPLNIAPPLSLRQATPTLTHPLYVKDVSRLFLETIKDHLEITIDASSSFDNKQLNWSIQTISPGWLETRYIQQLLLSSTAANNDDTIHTKAREAHLRKRFQNYLKNLRLYTNSKEKFTLDIQIQDKQISLSIPHAS
ncbi:MAG: hypothetical protein KDK65_05910 [Chlamydiia bacterium]|nr:hypothetical protein [Chlamydiia bacterium]